MEVLHQGAKIAQSFTAHHKTITRLELIVFLFKYECI